MKIRLPKIKSNLSAKRSTLKPCNSKTSPMTPDVLYNFLTLLQNRNKKYTSQKFDSSPNVRSEPPKTQLYIQRQVWKKIVPSSNANVYMITCHGEVSVLC
jgi:hypothetical protein